MIIDRYQFDLASLRESCRPYFIRWDTAVATGNSAEARAARRSLLAHTRAGLGLRAANQAGIYLFHRSRSSVEIEDLAYVGIAESPGRPMRTRIEDRLRDDSCFDAGLDSVSRLYASDRIRQRLRVAMPKSKKDYTEKHLSTCELVRASGRVLLNAVQAEAHVIKEAERLLVGSAAALNARLLNKNLLRFVGMASADGTELARAVVTALPEFGWSKRCVSSWIEQINKFSK